MTSRLFWALFILLVIIAYGGMIALAAKGKGGAARHGDGTLPKTG